MNNNINFPDNNDLRNIHLFRSLKIGSYSYKSIDNTFCFFKSINNIINLVFSSDNNSIVSFNLLKNEKINEIKNAHHFLISNIRYYLEENIKRDLIISISCDDRNIKLWDVNNWVCITNIFNAYLDGLLLSACLLINGNNSYIISSNCNYEGGESIKVFDFRGNNIKEINESNYSTYFIDVYFDKILFKNYIVAGNRDCVISYDFDNNLKYKEYSKNDQNNHDSLIVYDKGNIVNLIESSEDGNIRIWNFHTADLLKTISINYQGGIYPLYGICLWNEKYLFVGCENNIIKLIDLEEGTIIKDLIGHNNMALCIKKIYLPNYGDCLMSQGYEDDELILWNFN